MNSYVEHVRQPVGRGFERFFGWLAWFILIGVTAISLFAALVVLNNPTNINRLETLINRLNINMTVNGQLLSSSELALNIQNWIWLFIIYLIIVLIFSFIALVLMRWRVFSATVFLILAVVTIPLFIVLVPLFFFLVSILLFVRKDKIIPMQGRQQEPFVKHDQDRVVQQPRPSRPVQAEKEQREVRKEKPVARDEHVEKPEKVEETSQPTEQQETVSQSSNDEVLSRSKKHQKHKKHKQPVVENEDNNEQTEQTEQNQTEEVATEQQDPYNYETTQADEYQASEEKPKKEKKPKKVKPNAAIERRNNYDQRMQQQKKYFENKNQDAQNITNKDK
ncbi:DUF4064 domain-containing protein [Mammaliicoccus sp. Dog046]|uniref:DUF4064 domain-containing protein n=1 Tax=Mammaliicoccus sp. Dog046 TaxID=3034233 RepID=UPI002B25A1EE|nr:DUF4064 domain-containing protein [Mammaliicoccus sp. Dog046]WQK84700.1 DUF4064 domain-containing protein [Mammaliicoccus sp. Dog046]